MSKELTPTEIAEAEVDRQAEFGYEPSLLDYVIAGQQAERERIFQWGNEPCPEAVLTGRATKKRDCTRCWQTLSKEEGK